MPYWVRVYSRLPLGNSMMRNVLSPKEKSPYLLKSPVLTHSPFKAGNSMRKRLHESTVSAAMEPYYHKNRMTSIHQKRTNENDENERMLTRKAVRFAPCTPL